MGLLSGSMESLSLSNKSRRQSDASGTGGSTKGERPDGNENDMSELDKEEGNILMSIISQRELVRPAEAARLTLSGQYVQEWI